MQGAKDLRAHVCVMLLVLRRVHCPHWGSRLEGEGPTSQAGGSVRLKTL